jgi:hypothetical protein
MDHLNQIDKVLLFSQCETDKKDLILNLELLGKAVSFLNEELDQGTKDDFEKEFRLTLKTRM